MFADSPPEDADLAMPPLDPASIQAQLGRLLGARAFKASERLRRLLEYLVTSRLEGRSQELTQRHLAEHVFGRGTDFDPERDAIVRVEMRKLRKALELYYADAGAEDPVLISIPSGTYQPRIRMARPSGPGNAGPPAADRPDPVGIAILPFADLSPDAGRDWLANGIGEELNTILDRIPELHVMPPHTFPAGAGVREMTSRLIAERQVRFALEGSLRCMGDRIRATVRLHDLVRGLQIWSGRYDRDLSTASLLDIQEDIARNVVSGAADMFTGAIGLSLRSELTPMADGRLEIYEVLLRFHHYLHTTSDEAYHAAREALERTVVTDSANPMVLSMLADLRRAAFSLGFTDEADQVDGSLAMLHEALSKAPDCLPCRVSLCFALLHKRDRAGLLEQVEIVLHDMSSPASYRSDVAVPLALSGEWERGCRLIEEQMGDTRRYPHYFQYPFFLRAYRAGDYDQALCVADTFRPAPFFWQPLLRAAVLGKLGRFDLAQAQVQRLLCLRPDSAPRLRRFLRCYLMEDSLVDELVDGLDKAGLKPL